MTQRKAIVYIATSLDGYIAKENDDLSFLSMAEMEGEDFGYSHFEKSIDTIIMGRKTYDWLKTQIPELPYPNQSVYVVSKTPRSNDGHIQFLSEDLSNHVKKLKTEQGKNLFIVGGAQVIKTLLENKLIDEFIITMIPILLGNGIPLFLKDYPEQALELTNSNVYKNGVVQLHYTVK